MDWTTSVIRRLPEHVVAKVRSSVTITSLTDVVLGLLCNSLDARSQKIEVTVDFARGSCCVEDDGIGILPQDFKKSGGLGAMHHSSKSEDERGLNLHGGEGIFLASVSALALVTISSKHEQHYSQNSMTLYRSEIIERQLPCASHRRLLLSSNHGTRVEVRDLFGAMPVRVKQRASQATSETEQNRLWRTLINEIHALLLAWPHGIELHLTAGQTPEKSLTVHGRSKFVSTDIKKSLSTETSLASTLHRTRALLLQAGQLQPSLATTFVPITVSTVRYIVTGVISTEPAPTKNVQFLSIGIHPCRQTALHSDLFQSVNNAFEASDFGLGLDDMELASDNSTIEQDRRNHKHRGSSIRERLKARRKGVDRWPMFYIRIEMRRASADLSRSLKLRGEGAEDLKGVVEIINVLAHSWLEAHHFRPTKQKRKKHSHGPSTKAHQQTLREYESGQKRVRSSSAAPMAQSGDSDQVSAKAPMPIINSMPTASGTQAQQRPASASFASWSRIKSGDRSFLEQQYNKQHPNKGSRILQDLKNVQAQASTKNWASPHVFNIEPLQAGELSNLAGRSDQAGSVARLPNTAGDCRLIEWQDPITKQTLQIDPRTGLVVVHHTKTSSTSLSPTSALHITKPSFRLSAMPLVAEEARQSRNGHAGPTWIKGFLDTWETPLFSAQREKSIPATSAQPVDAALCSHTHSRGSGRHDTFEKSGLSKISKMALSQAKVISQVDQKYILVTLPSDIEATNECNVDPTMLILIDQHAASERCILEKLLYELCQPAFMAPSTKFSIKTSAGLTSEINTITLTMPMLFEISESEHKSFERHAAHFAHWGVLYNLRSRSSTIMQTGLKSLRSILSVVSLPPLISERCLNEPRTLIELLRGEMYHKEESGQKHRSPAAKPPSSESTIQYEKQDWLRHIGSCPKGILDLVNSRACRSAIMFNDKLSINECHDLVKELSHCAFPFICAHGRVSMVPLLTLETRGIVGNSSFDAIAGIDREEGHTAHIGYADAFTKWKNEMSR